MTIPSDQAFAIEKLRNFAWRLVIYAHLVASAFWWWLMPGGFPIAHPRFWSNLVLPVAGLCLCGIALLAERFRRESLLAVIGTPIPAFWFAAAVFGVLVFPVSARRFLPPVLAVTFVLSLLWLWRFGWRDLARLAVWPAIILAIAVGGGAVWSQRGPDSQTRPLNVPLAIVSPGENPLPAIALGSGVFQPYDGSVRMVLDSATHADGGAKITLDIAPLLTFESRSPDRCWTILAPRHTREGFTRRLKGFEQKDLLWLARYEDDGESTLSIRSRQDESTLEIEACSTLERPVYSHLNTFAQILVRGHTRLFVSFSPCPETRLEFQPADYPIGRAAQAAFVDAEGQFHVVRASSGEKGPYEELARGPLPQDEPLILTLWNGELPICRIGLDDFAPQADHQLSPSAGWGVPVSAIEFRLVGDAPNSPAGLWITLAGTSLGRGWDSVGHAAGTYRNRIRVEAIFQ